VAADHPAGWRTRADGIDHDIAHLLHRGRTGSGFVTEAGQIDGHGLQTVAHDLAHAVEGETAAPQRMQQKEDRAVGGHGSGVGG